MNINIAALLREDAKTIKVRFFKDSFKSTDDTFTLLGKNTNIPSLLSEKEYTYVTNLPVKVGDTVIVSARDAMQLAWVSTIDDGVDIMPTDSIRYRWVISVVDMRYYQELQEANKKLELIVSKAYKTHTRKQFGQLLLAELGLSETEELKQLISSRGGKENEQS